MKPIKALFVTAFLAVPGGCVVAPVDPGYYAGPQVYAVPPPVYYLAPTYYAPPVRLGIYGGRGYRASPINRQIVGHHPDNRPRP